MKRFNLFQFVFALVCGCHIIGVQSNRRSHGIYLDPIGICKGAPYDDQSSVVQIVPGLDTCGSDNTTLNVIMDEYLKQVFSIDDCQKYCQSDINCTHFEFDKNNKKCSLTGKKSFGTKAKHIVTGYAECPKIGKCPYVGTDYYRVGYGRKWNINSPKECQKYCRTTYGSKAVINYGFFHKLCYCKKAFNFGIGFTREWISGPLHCHRCFGFKFDLSKLQNVYNGSPKPFLIKATVKACQKSCKDNPLCDWFQFDPWTGKCHHKNPRTARMMKCNTAFASRDCDGIIGCKPCNPEGVINGDHSCGLLGNCLSCNKKQGYTGIDCSTCMAEYFEDGRKCRPCNCDLFGSKGRSCHTRISGYGIGQCPCWFGNYEGRQCHKCVKGHRRSNGGCCPPKSFYDIKNRRCTDCNCDQYGSQSRDCDIKSGQCPCWFDSYKGRRCHECVQGQIKANGRCCFNHDYYHLQNNRCEDCNCDRYGSQSKGCNPNTGQCPCWFDSYKGRRCHECVPGQRKAHGRCCFYHTYYHLKNNRCEDCDCYKGGSKGTGCDAKNGQCSCRWRYKGRRCKDVGREPVFWSESDGRKKIGSIYWTNNAVRYYVVLKHKCHTSCDLRYIGIKSYGKNVFMWASTKTWYVNEGLFGSYGHLFCSKFTNSKFNGECTEGVPGGYTEFYLLFYSRGYFGHSEYELGLGNYLSHKKCKGFTC